MSLIEIITKQLKSYPKFKKQARIGYFASLPLEQVHMDTMFWQRSGELDSKKTPILCIVDVATRYTMYFVQQTKNDSVKNYLTEFIRSVKAKWKPTAKKMLLITDGARELQVSAKLDNVQVETKISRGINKAVLAEVGIRKARAILRDYELRINVNNLETGRNPPYRIENSNLPEIFELLQEQVNLKAKIRKPKPPTAYSPPSFQLGDPVFALNFYKYFPHQMKARFIKQGYMQNWYYEPFYISKVFLINGVYKYALKGYADDKELKYNFYDDQLQPIDPEYVSDYIRYYVKNGAKIADSEEA